MSKILFLFTSLLELVTLMKKKNRSSTPTLIHHSKVSLWLFVFYFVRYKAQYRW